MKSFRQRGNWQGITAPLDTHASLRWRRRWKKKLSQRGGRAKPFMGTAYNYLRPLQSMQSTTTPSSPGNRGSRRQLHLEHPSSLDFDQNSYLPLSPTTFPQHDQLSLRPTDQYDFPAPTFQRQRAISSYALDSATVKFPEPQLYRAGSSKAAYRPLTPNLDSRNDLRTQPRPSPPPPPTLPHRNSTASPKTDTKVHLGQPNH